MPNARRSALIVMSDGEPSAKGRDPATGHLVNYEGEVAIQFIKNVCKWAAERMRVDVYLIGIDGEVGDNFGARAYGEGRYVCLPAGCILESGHIIANFVAKLAAKS